MDALNTSPSDVNKKPIQLPKPTIVTKNADSPIKALSLLCIFNVRCYWHIIIIGFEVYHMNRPIFVFVNHGSS